MPRRPALRLAALGLLTGTTVIGMATARPAAAHGPDGVMTVITLQPSGDDAVRVEVGLTYANDGDLAEDAQVEAVLRNGNVSVGPERLDRESGGRYAADITVPGPGTWAVSVTSTEPEAEATGAVNIDAPTTTGAPTTTAAEATTTSEPPTTTVPPASDATEDDSSALPLVIALVAGGLVLLAGVAVVVLRSGQDDETDETDELGAGPEGPAGPDDGTRPGDDGRPGA